MEAKKIREIFIYGTGDESVGIFPATCKVVSDGDFICDTGCLAEENRAAYLEDLRRGLSAVFAEAWDDKVGVSFDFEEARYAADEAAAFEGAP